MARTVKRTVTIDQFIGKLIRDFQLTTIPDKYDVLEFVSEALSEMTVTGATEKAVVCFNVDEHIGCLPLDVIQVHQFGTFSCIESDIYGSFPGEMVGIQPFRKATSTLGKTNNLTYSEVANGIYRFSIRCGRVFANVSRQIIDAEGLPQIPASFNGLNAVAYYVMSCLEKPKMHKLKSNNYQFYYEEWRRLLDQHLSDEMSLDRADFENIENINRRFFKGRSFDSLYSKAETNVGNNLAFNSYRNNLSGYSARFGTHITDVPKVITQLYSNNIKIDCLTEAPSNVCAGYPYYNPKDGKCRFWNPVSGWELVHIGTILTETYK